MEKLTARRSSSEGGGGGGREGRGGGVPFSMSGCMEAMRPLCSGCQPSSTPFICCATCSHGSRDSGSCKSMLAYMPVDYASLPTLYLLLEHVFSKIQLQCAAYHHPLATARCNPQAHVARYSIPMAWKALHARDGKCSTAAPEQDSGRSSQSLEGSPSRSHPTRTTAAAT